MKNFLSSMEHALCVGTPKASSVPIPKKRYWPAEFRRPVDAALHVGTPKPSSRRQRGKPPQMPPYID